MHETLSRRPWRWRLGVIGVLLAGVIAVPPARADEALPFFDAHIHYNEPAWRVFPPEEVAALFARRGVTGALVSSTPQQGTSKLQAAAPERVVPELRPYRGPVSAGNWTHDPAIVDWLAARLKAGSFAAIGEIHIYKMESADWEVMGRVAALARQHGVFLHVHARAPIIERVLALDPQVDIIWAHAGLHDGPETIARMLDAHPRLIAELSLRAPNIMPPLKEGMDPAWRALLLRHQDRIIVGTDTYMNISWVDYEELLAAHRRWLTLLPRAAAEKIAYRNAERLFGKHRKQ
jgi:hypothetical protein